VSGDDAARRGDRPAPTPGDVAGARTRGDGPTVPTPGHVASTPTPGDVAGAGQRRTPTGPVPGPTTGPVDTGALRERIDALLASDCTGQEEAELLEEAHRLVNDALEGR
ncbi:hypothetical protein, partial [Corynebacterium bovis]|uniref:hypothetical protein n=1 Tax=Corynebacterium bovis TaxID=36808 RepID=UPI001C8A9C98